MKLVINNASLLPGQQDRIDAALEALKTDPHAPNELAVRIRVHVHQEYPKVIGDKVVNSAEEEQADKAARRRPEFSKAKEPKE